MFMEVKAKRDVRVQARHLGNKVKARIAEQLVLDIEGKNSGTSGCAIDDGIVVAVTAIEKIGILGELPPNMQGDAVFPVAFRCLVCKVYPGEVLEAQVCRVSKMGIFAEAGPLQIFVSPHNIPQYIEFERREGNMDWGDVYTDGEQITIKAGSCVLLRIIKPIYQEGQLKSIGTMLGDHLGLINDYQ